MDEFKFYLGCPEPSWLHRTDVPLMISRRRTMRVKKIARATCEYTLDSSGYTELGLYGKWEITDDEYVREVRRLTIEVGGLRVAAIKDWMCEETILRKTGLSVLEHQEKTVASYLSLMDRDSGLPWMPVIQGWTPDEYMRCVDMYDRAGVDLRTFDIVGVGTMCRRQATKEGLCVLSRLSGLGIRLHGFGFKTDGLPMARKYLASADSLAWSKDAFYSAPLQGCEHRNCANCIRYALAWRERVVALSGYLPAGSIVPASVYRSPRRMKDGAVSNM